MRSLTTLVIVLVVVAGLFSYLALPDLIENRLAENLQQRYGLRTEPEVEVTSSFPPEMLLGNIDRIQVRTDRVRRQGVTIRNVRVDLRGVNVSAPSLLQGNPEIQTQSCTLRAQVPGASINQYLECEGAVGLTGR